MDRHIQRVGALIFDEQELALSGINRAMAHTHEFADAIVYMNDVRTLRPVRVGGLRSLAATSSRSSRAGAVARAASSRKISASVMQ